MAHTDAISVACKSIGIAGDIFSLLKINGGHRIFKVYKKDKNHSAQFFLTYETKDAKEAHQIVNRLESEGF